MTGSRRRKIRIPASQMLLHRVLMANIRDVSPNPRKRRTANHSLAMTKSITVSVKQSITPLVRVSLLLVLPSTIPMVVTKFS